MTYLVGKDIKLVKFTDRFITSKYTEWLNDQEINRYMYTGRIPVSIGEIENRNNQYNIMFAIMSKLYYNDDTDLLEETDNYSQFIGIVSIDCIDWINRKGEIVYLIGEKTHWGVGLATEAVNLISEYALNRLNLNKVEAGVVEGNVGSIKVLEKNGFKEYGVVPKDYWIEGKYYDVHRFYKLQEW